jgi:hypothetical protein
MTWANGTPSRLPAASPTAPGYVNSPVKRNTPKFSVDILKKGEKTIDKCINIVYIYNYGGQKYGDNR